MSEYYRRVAKRDCLDYLSQTVSACLDEVLSDCRTGTCSRAAYEDRGWGFAQVLARTHAESVDQNQCGVACPTTQGPKARALYRTSFFGAAHGKSLIAKPFKGNAWIRRNMQGAQS